VRVLIVTSGSMGDVAPYTGLATRLRDAGHEVTIAAHAASAAIVAACGLPFRELPGDLRAILQDAPGQDTTSSGTGPGALARLRRLARPLIAALGDGITAATTATRAEVLLLSTVVAPLGYQVATAAGIPWAGVFLQPIQETRDFGPVLTGGRPLGPWGNLLGARLAEVAARTLYRGPVRDLRARLGLPAAAIGRLSRVQRFRYPTFHGFSPAVVPRPADWPASQEVVGYWWPARTPGWTPPGELSAFLDDGPPPVFIGFGSMAPGRGATLAGPVLQAVARAGVRAVVQSGWAGLSVAGSDRVLGVGEVPHDWLFPRTAAAIHHAGAGTTAAALRAGVPAVTVPVSADQPFWGRRLNELGAAPPPIPLHQLTAARLAAAIREVTTDPHYAARAQALSARLSTEDSTTRILTWLAGL
jgi:UDP:flavonoid glycosyltransferase YjiC (YdhE family)